MENKEKSLEAVIQSLKEEIRLLNHEFYSKNHVRYDEIERVIDVLAKNSNSSQIDESTKKLCQKVYNYMRGALEQRKFYEVLGRLEKKGLFLILQDFLKPRRDSEEAVTENG